MIQALVFEGGGVRGAAYAGAMMQLASYTDISQISFVGGSSVGAITATLVAVGYSPTQLLDLAYEVPYEQLMPKVNPIKRIYRLLRYRGMYYSHPLKAFMREKVKAATDDSDINFAELKRIRGVDLRIVATNARLQKVLELSAQTTPDLPIVQAAIYSMTIPFIFIPEKFCGFRITDGGVVLNYPIRLFDQVIDPATVLGIRLDTTQEVESSTDGNFGYAPGKYSSSLKDFALSHLNLLYERANKAYLKESDWRRTVFVDCGDISALDFNLAPEIIEDLVARGRVAVDRYSQDSNKHLDQWNS